jgi:hypothetical protein
MKENLGKKFPLNTSILIQIFSTNIDKDGICYRLYPRSLFDEKINDNINSEMARQPLLVSENQSGIFIQLNYRRISCKQNYLLGLIVRLQNLC